MKVADKAALAVGAVGTWIYIGGVDSDLWGRAALGAGGVPAGSSVLVG